MSTELAVPGDGDEAAPAATDAAAEAPAAQPPGQSAGPAKVIYADIVSQPGDRRDIIPARFHRDQLRATVDLWVAIQWHRVRYHGLRSPGYVLGLLFWAVYGAVRLIVRQVHWAWLLEQHDLRSDAIIAGDSKEWRALHKIAMERRRLRLGVLGAELGAALAVSAWLTFAAPWWAQAGAAIMAAWAGARFGRPIGHKLVTAAIIPPEYSRPSQSMITDALGSLGIANINKAIKDGPGIRFISDPYQDGPGWGCQLDLPAGVTAGHIIGKRPELASGLRRPLSATWPEGVPEEHEGRLQLWIGFHDISKSKPVRHPLLKGGTTDIFQAIPFGTDPRQRPVTVPLFEVNWLVGAAPGQGKTNVVRDLAAGAAVDAVCDIWIHEHAGKGDLEPFAQVCHRYCTGLDDDAIAYAAESARKLRTELERRSRLFKKLPRHMKPEGKLTRDLAVAHRQLRPIVAIFDECQNIFMHPELGAQAADDLAYVIRLGRAYGIIVILATQRPDKESLPTAIRGIVTARFCMQVPDQDGNDMILGTGAYKSGYNCVLFRPKTDRGMGWLKADAAPQVVRTYKLDLEPAGQIAARARALRERLGVLTGYALGLDDDGQGAPRDVLADVLAMFAPDEPGQHWDVLAQRLADSWPERYAGLTHTALSAQCRALGVTSVTVSVGGFKDKGCRKSQLEQLAADAVSVQVSPHGGNQS